MLMFVPRFESIEKLAEWVRWHVDDGLAEQIERLTESELPDLPYSED